MNGEEINGSFYEKELQNTSQEIFRIEKVLKRGIDCTSNGKIEKGIDCTSNYATKTDLKNVAYVHTSSFAFKRNLANLKTEVDKLNIDKSAPVPVDLSKMSDVEKNDVVKKTVYDKLVTKLNNINDFVLKV